MADADPPTTHRGVAACLAKGFEVLFAPVARPAARIDDIVGLVCEAESRRAIARNARDWSVAEGVAWPPWPKLRFPQLHRPLRDSLTRNSSAPDDCCARRPSVESHGKQQLVRAIGAAASCAERSSGSPKRRSVPAEVAPSSHPHPSKPGGRSSLAVQPGAPSSRSRARKVAPWPGNRSC